MLKRVYVLKRPWQRAIARAADGLLDGLAIARSPSFTWTSIQKLLILRLDHIGDVVLSLPVYRAVKRENPGLHLTVLVSSDGAAVLRDEPSINEIWTYEAPWFARHLVSGKGYPEFLRLVAKIRCARFDAAIDLRGDLRHILLLWLAGIPLRLGYGITGGGPLLTHELSYDGEQHVLQRNLVFLNIGGSKTDTWDGRLILNESPAERTWIHQFESLPRPWILLHSGAGTASKQWPQEHLDTFLAMAQNALRGTLILIGLESTLLSSGSAEGGALRTLDLRGKTSLQQLLSLLMRGDSLISTDSGPLHLGAALGIPCLSLWSGVNNPTVWAPVFPYCYRLQHEVPCQYCERRVCPIAGHPCMSGLRPEDVLRKTQELLEYHTEHRN
ncbi:MAG: glycosyltransferase family 9 protein [Elusimicrobia bacterium]|nr:glycosyltransferase family 9 protein [Elusimicrobiota bacterium]